MKLISNAGQSSPIWLIDVMCTLIEIIFFGRNPLPLFTRGNSLSLWIHLKLHTFLGKPFPTRTLISLPTQVQLHIAWRRKKNETSQNGTMCTGAYSWVFFFITVWWKLGLNQNCDPGKSPSCILEIAFHHTCIWDSLERKGRRDKNSIREEYSWNRTK